MTTINYSYDPLYRLTAANYSTGSVYTNTYDAVGNRLSRGAPTGIILYTYDDANRLSSAGSVAYTWDNNGNLLAGNSFTYVYDAANRPTEVRPNPGLGYTAYDYAYSGLGDMQHESVTVCVGVCTGGNTTVTTYTLDLNAGLTQQLADGTNTYLYGNGRIAQYVGASAQYFLDDALGSVRQLADASGAVNLALSYEPYGLVLNSVGAGTTSFGFTGEWTDALTGLVDLRARWYAPGQGRFLTKDTWAGRYINLADAGGSYDGSGTGQFSTGGWYVDYTRPQSLNGWAYADGDPINLTDPTGHQAQGSNASSCLAWGWIFDWATGFHWGCIVSSFPAFNPWPAPSKPAGQRYVCQNQAQQEEDVCPSYESEKDAIVSDIIFQLHQLDELIKLLKAAKSPIEKELLREGIIMLTDKLDRLWQKLEALRAAADRAGCDTSDWPRPGDIVIGGPPSEGIIP